MDGFRVEIKSVSAPADEWSADKTFSTYEEAYEYALDHLAEFCSFSVRICEALIEWEPVVLEGHGTATFPCRINPLMRSDRY